MTRFASVILAALIAFSAVVTSASSPAEARKGRNTALAAGAVLGLAAALALSNSSNANAEPRRRNDFARQCRNLYNRCINGSNRACDRYETGGCTE